MTVARLTDVEPIVALHQLADRLEQDPDTVAEDDTTGKPITNGQIVGTVPYPTAPMDTPRLARSPQEAILGGGPHP